MLLLTVVAKGEGEGLEPPPTFEQVGADIPPPQPTKVTHQLCKEYQLLIVYPRCPVKGGC